MEDTQVKTQIKIAICLLGSSRTDGYGNGNLTHSQRNLMIETITNLLVETLSNLDQKADSIITEKQSNFNPPDES
jgi:hypothetical protein